MKKLILTALLAVCSGIAHPEEAEKSNVVEVFVGGTHVDDSNEFSLGMTYERRLSEKIGLGVTAERTKGREYVAVVPLF